jgi:LysM repeat protein
MLPLVAAVTLAAPAAAQADFMHTVMPGESLTSIAATDGLTVAQLAAANGISPFTRLIAGSTLAIPPQGASVATTASASTSSTSVCDGDNDADDTGCSTGGAASASSAGGSYLVRPGDTLSGIAARAGTTVAALASLNGLNPKHYLLYGTVLRLPGASSVPASSVASSEPVGAAAVGSLKAPPYPTRQRVSAGQIGSIAAANGVPPSLAQAIGWQESGFNNDLVSPVGARGVMQILPGTWNWIGQVLNRGGMPLAPASALDNVRGGVIMLHALLGATGGNQAEAAAGYYQGLSSVQQHGMYPSTKQYVRDVLALSQRFGGG